MFQPEWIDASWNPYCLSGVFSPRSGAMSGVCNMAVSLAGSNIRPASNTRTFTPSMVNV
jgi:hypothetical protein